ncbi:MAG: NAD(P)/FAD-dependent oxidoreductase [Verrucomicrobiales bacterium]|nr:NAD(P)/FAD-dependent oxidoreductase [Verrucomicrobiales bacterium]
MFDLLVIGGGAAGFFGAISFAERAPGSRVAILEKSSQVLGKVKISGGGRCNVTHACFQPRELTAHYPRGERVLIGPFHYFSTTETIEWFESRGVALKTEADGRMFPVTDDSQTVMDCLTASAADLGIETRLRAEVRELQRVDESWQLTLESGETLRSRSVLLATGGTRNGAGERLAGTLGHQLIPAIPSLFTFKIQDPRIEDLAGVSVENVIASVDGMKLRTSGPCLITHWGLSGPAILRLSAWGARELSEREFRFTVRIQWCGEESRDSVEEKLQAQRDSGPKRRVSSGCDGIALPSRLWKRLVEAAGIGEETIWTSLTKRERNTLVEQLTGSCFEVLGKSMNKDEFVTAGGVDLREVHTKTMQSRICPGLYFAGEVLNIDGITGGFNFQAAWTTSRIAGESAADQFAG